MKPPADINQFKFKPSHSCKQLKLGEVWQTTGRIAYQENGDIDLGKATSLENRKVADIYLDLSTSEWLALEAIKHAPGVVGMSVVAVPVAVK